MQRLSLEADLGNIPFDTAFGACTSQQRQELGDGAIA